MINLVLMGPPGAGKGTQAEYICNALNIPHISTGDMFRNAIKEGSRLGLIAKGYIEDGHLVPDDVTIALVKERLSKQDCANGYLLDGFPRTVVQGKALQEMALEINREITDVINIDAHEDVLLKRISGRRVCKNCSASYHIVTKKPKVDGICDKCGGELIIRKDDNPTAFKIRIDHYIELTKPLINYYKDLNLLHDVNGDDCPKLISEHILEL